MLRKFLYALWVPKGRRARIAWLAWSIIHLFIIGGAIAPFSSESHQDNPAIDILAIVLGLVWIWWTLVNSAKRWHDLNCPGWLAPSVFLPLVPLFMLVLSGSAETNKYGAKPSSFLP